MAAHAALGPAPAHATDWKADISGRWTSQKFGYVIDITRCGTEWCGIRLKADLACGALALRLSPVSTGGDQGRLNGTLTLDPAAQTYKVGATPEGPAGERPAKLFLAGNPDAPPHPLSRMILFQDSLVRGPEASCLAEGKVS